MVLPIILIFCKEEILKFANVAIKRTYSKIFNIIFIYTFVGLRHYNFYESLLTTCYFYYFSAYLKHRSYKIMEEKAVIIQNNNQKFTLVINRPNALNAINYEVMSSLHAFFTSNYQNPDIHGVIITGQGEKAFVAGADIKQFIGVTAHKGSEIAKFGHDTFNAIEQFHAPVIAAVNGFALGGGCELAMACHIRIAAQNAKFGQPEVNLGLIPGYGGSLRLAQLIGKGRATEMLLTGDPISADLALQYGLVTHIVEQEFLLLKANEILDKIINKGPNAIRAMIRLLNSHNINHPNLIEEYKLFGLLMDSEECREGVEAFINKRKANFRN
jgi:enoyl-CoA hydratase